ncbi:uncharacterized protein MAM_01176 [Metarhizium album ARSEF 1941]|uniref:Uncharacterized protein n=1 Tax=Metarhizium album (strain ARSEF 1941) TaxID=1081103 RepID=A0A0B2X3S5_METAS|nr:uncharacterized protein MAM_01176 [Metarhizium album ARSEF 1941]KHO00398.1 hypothetical protein MAM_01176 [Metarhizium album ARSEF 1941]
MVNEDDVESQRSHGQDELRERYDRLMRRLMTLQGRKENETMADSEARNKFQGLQQAISNWANKVRQDLLRTGKLDFILRAVDKGDSHVMRKLSSLFSANLDADASPNGPHAGESDDMAWAQWLGRHPRAINVVLSLGVWSGLQKYVMCRPFPVGIDAYLEQMFNEAIDAMDEESVQGWTSQTMKALSRTGVFDAERSAQVKSISAKMWRALHAWPLQHFSRSSKHYQGLKGLVESAADLHRDLRCSWDRFDLVYPRDLVRGPLPDDVSHWHLLNISQFLSLSGREDSEGALLCLYPGLDRHLTDNKATSDICKPTILVYDGDDVKSMESFHPARGSPPSRRRHVEWSAQKSKKAGASTKRSGRRDRRKDARDERRSSRKRTSSKRRSSK